MISAITPTPQMNSSKGITFPKYIIYKAWYKDVANKSIRQSTLGKIDEFEQCRTSNRLD